MAKDYYIILGISPNATEDEIRSAYRQLAKKFHPDHFAGGCQPFLDIHEAYSVLSNPQRRLDYDRQMAARRISRHSRQDRTRNVAGGWPAPEPLFGSYPAGMQSRHCAVRPRPEPLVPNSLDTTPAGWNRTCRTKPLPEPLCPHEMHIDLTKVSCAPEWPSSLLSDWLARFWEEWFF